MKQNYEAYDVMSMHEKRAHLMLLLGIFSLCAVPFFLLPAILPFLENILPYALFYSLISFEHFISSSLEGVIPFDTNLLYWAFTALFISLFFFFNAKRRYHSNMTAYAGTNKNYCEISQPEAVIDKSRQLSQLKEQLQTSAGAVKNERDDLLKLYAETKKKLDNMGQDHAFLSIDVVDSTGMKQGEEKASIEHDFKEYKQLVEDAISANASQKSAWTPDGVMVCFASVEDAVNTARQVIKGLKDFNANVKTIRSDFRVRCGINYGHVYSDESIPMEEMSDRVIDVAGHMQKYASPNSIFMDKALVWFLQDRSGFSPAGTEVDGYEVFVWRDEG
jgi:class 3 adenylate cyclase